MAAHFWPGSREKPSLCRSPCPANRFAFALTQSKPGYATAETGEIVTASPERVTPACPHFGACGGCHYQHTGYETQRAFKQAILRETLERGGVAVPGEIAVLAAKPWAYRNRIRLAFDAAGNSGYRGRRSHAVIPIRECPIAAPLLLQAHTPSRKLHGNFPQPCAPLKSLSSAMRAKPRCWQSLYCQRQGDSFRRIHADSSRADSRLKGAELVAEGHAGQPPAPSRNGAPFSRLSAAGFDYRVTTAHSSR